jgi:hypothetical protein
MGGLMARLAKLFAVGCVSLVLLFTVGCYESKFALGSQDKATVDPGYVGDFVVDSNEKKTETIIIRNIDNHLYYVEYVGEEEPLRMVGYTSDVNGMTFANLRKLTDDGSIDDSYLILRVAISDDHSKLTLQNLKEDFFKDKNITSSDQLEKLISANLNNGQMYDGEAATATRVLPAKKP